MNGAQRLNAIMKRERINALSWSTLIDSAALEGLPESMGGFSPFDSWEAAHDVSFDAQNKWRRLTCDLTRKSVERAGEGIW